MGMGQNPSIGHDEDPRRQVHKVKFAIRREGNADTRMQAIEETLHLASLAAEFSVFLCVFVGLTVWIAQTWLELTGGFVGFKMFQNFVQMKVGIAMSNPSEIPSGYSTVCEAIAHRNRFMMITVFYLFFSGHCPILRGSLIFIWVESITRS